MLFESLSSLFGALCERFSRGVCRQPDNDAWQRVVRIVVEGNDGYDCVVRKSCCVMHIRSFARAPFFV